MKNKSISANDVMEVAFSLKMDVTPKMINFVIENYESEADSDPTGCFPFWVENLLYRSLNELED